MSHGLIDRKLQSLLVEPTEKKFRSLRRSAISERDYDPRARPILRLEAGLGHVDPTETLWSTDQLAWFWRICPRFHFVRARAHEALDDHAGMSDCVAQMQNCLRAILSTGNGSQNSPYLVTFVTDERDLLRVLGEEPRNQQLVQVQNRCCDVVTSHDGQDVWFDVTDVVARLPRRRQTLALRG